MEHLRLQYRRLFWVCLGLGFVLTALAWSVNLFHVAELLAIAPGAWVIFALMAAICGSAMCSVCFGFLLVEQGMAEQARLRADAGCRASIDALWPTNPWAAAQLEADYQQFRQS